MKLIGFGANDTFIVETTEEEIAKAAGFHSAHDHEWKKLRGDNNWGSNGRWKIGTEFKVGATISYVRNLLQNEKRLDELAGFLRSLADMITHGKPTVISAPPPPEGEAIKSPAEA